MIKALVIALVAFLYFLIGTAIFELGVRSLGGKEGYLQYVKESNTKHYKAAYVLAKMLVYFFWPYFLIKTLFSK